MLALALGLTGIAGACHAADAGADGDAVPDVTPAESGPFVLGVQTHFGQRWPASRLEAARAVDAPLLRDGLAWPALEPRPGEYVLPAATLAPLDRACAGGMQLMLTVVPTHPDYDGGQMVTSKQGVAAFGAYLDQLARHFGKCLVGIEVGNEINGSAALRRMDDLPAAYVALMQGIYRPFKAVHPQVALVGGSTNAVGTGFLVRLFRNGLLDHADGIAVHPYRGHGENVSWEIANLNAAMHQQDRVLPIWASEFGDRFEQPRDAASAVVKMATQLSGAGVKMASWYALADQKWFPTMGLVTQRGAEKPAAAAFRFMQRELLPHGRPVQVSTDRLAALWRFGQDRWVVWGVPRALNLQPGTAVFDATGERVNGTAMVGTAPLVVVGAKPGLGQSPVLADSLLQFGARPWNYLAGDAAVLAPLDSDFATSLGRRDLRPLRIDDATGATIAAQPVTVRYTAPQDMRASLLACFSHGRNSASTLAITATGPAGEVGRTVLERRASLQADVTLRAGDSLDLRFAPATGKGGHTFGYRIRLYRPGTAPQDCPREIAEWS
ncbi:MAG: hypothetical protein RLZZ08_124 [Pseudomonadota bacterium]